MSVATATSGKPGIDRPLLALLLAVSVPTTALWIDYEQARRALLLMIAGVLALLATRWCRGPQPAGLAPLGGLAGLAILQLAFGPTNFSAGVDGALYWISLSILFAWASRRSLPTVLGSVAVFAAGLAALGLAQRLGLPWPGNFDLVDNPVATLGNRNVAAEIVAVGLGASVARCLAGADEAPRARERLGPLTLVPIALYLGVNGSRSGLLAALLVAFSALIPALCAASARRRLVVALSVLGLAAAGYGLRAEVQDSAPPTPSPESASTSEVVEHATTKAATPSTIDVRLAMWRSGLDMIADAPLFGHGTGQFRFEYPRYRSDAEIELSTFGRRFPSAPVTLHNDPLQLAVEGGVPALLLLLAGLGLALRQAWRTRPTRAVLLPVVAFAVTAAVRSPFGNAPAAFALAVVLGCAAARPAPAPAPAPEASPSRGRGATIFGALLGVLLLLVGGTRSYAAQAAAAWLGGGEPGLLQTAIRWHGGEPNYHLLQIEQACGGVAGGSLRAATAAAADSCAASTQALRELHPADTNARYLLAELAYQSGDTARARTDLQEVLELDPRHPRATLLLATIEALSGEFEAARARLYASPHPTLRAQLLATTSRLGTTEGVPFQNEWAQEGLILMALERSLAEPVSIETNRAIKNLEGTVDIADDRYRILLAHQALSLGQTDAARQLAPDRPIEIDAGSRELMQQLLQRLRELPEWRRILSPP